MRNTDPYCQYSANKSLEQMKSIVDGKFGNINNLKPSCEKSLAAALMDAFKRSLSINETFPNMKNSNMSDFALNYQSHMAQNNLCRNKIPKYYCIVCPTQESLVRKSACNFNGYLSELLCDGCTKRIKASKEYGCAFPGPLNRQPKSHSGIGVKGKSSPNNEPLFATSKAANSEDELSMYWMEVRNAIYQVFFHEGFQLNSVVRKYIQPPICAYCMPPNSMLKAMVKKLYQAHQHKFFLLTVCHVQLFVMEIKLCLIKELLHMEKPYFIFAIFYTLFQRLLRALHKTNKFLDIIENEFLQKNSLHWYQIHFLFLQVIVYMNRFIQKIISMLCDCSTENGLKTDDNDESRLVGKFVYRSYIVLEQSMASFSIYTNTNSSNFAVFFSKFDDFQMLFQFAILLFNCKNYDENIFSKRFFSTDFAVKNLRDMPHLSNDLLLIDALNTVAFQLFLVIHHWDSTDVFDNVMRRLPTVECTKSSRSIIKTILTESFIEVGYDESTLLADFFAYIQMDVPDNCCFDELLAQEICLSDEENYDDESFCSEDSFGQIHNGHHGCDCYSDMHYHNEHWLPSSRSYHEMRDRLRHRLTTRRREKQPDFEHKNDISPRDSCLEGSKVDDRNLDDLLNFINGDGKVTEDGHGDKKRKKSKKKRTKNNENAENDSGSKGNVLTHSEEIHSKSRKKKNNKKQKNKDKIIQNEADYRLERSSFESNTFLENDTEIVIEDFEKDEEDAEEDECEEACQTVAFTLIGSEDLNQNPIEYKKEMNRVLTFESHCQSDNAQGMVLEQNSDSNFLDVFKPKEDLDLDSEDLDEFEKELERFKRFCYNSMSSALDAVKPKLTICNVKEIFSKRKCERVSMPLLSLDTHTSAPKDTK